MYKLLLQAATTLSTKWDNFYVTVFTFIIRNRQRMAIKIKKQINMKFNAIEKETAYRSVCNGLG